MTIYQKLHYFLMKVPKKNELNLNSTHKLNSFLYFKVPTI